MTDQHRWDAIGANGSWVRTPHLDRIAAKGVNFTNCITNSPICKAARMAFATGLYPHNTGVWGKEPVTLSPDANTWMQQVREAGYRTSLFGKTHLHHQSGDFRDGESLLHAYGLDDVDEIGGPWVNSRVKSNMSETWREAGLLEVYQNDIAERTQSKRETAKPSALPLEHYPDVYVAQKARQYLENYASELPWFCWLGFSGPHRPWDAPEPYASMYNADDMPLPVAYQASPLERPRGYLDKRLAEDAAIPADRAAFLRANYAGGVSLIDDQIGQVLDVIEHRGELDNTIVVFTADHGELAGDYGLVDKRVFLNGVVKVPLIISTPEIAAGPLAGRSCPSLIELMDLGPTLLDLLGKPMEYRQYGRAFSACLRAPTAAHRDFVCSEIFGEKMYMDSQWKIALNASAEPYLLFDIENDPQESHNLAGQPDKQQLCEKLCTRLAEFSQRTGLSYKVTGVVRNAN